MRSRAEKTINYTILGVFALIAVYPLVGITLVAIGPSNQTSSGVLPIPNHLSLGNFSHAWQVAQLSGALTTSAIVAVGAVAIATIVSILAGYAFGAMRMRGSNLLFYLFLAGLIMPYEAIIIPLYYDLRSVNLAGTYWSLILPEAGLYLAFGTFWMRAFFRSVPRSLFEAARIDGASSWNTLWRVLIPFARPAVFTMMVLFFIWSWNEFLLPLVMFAGSPRQTATLALANFTGQYTTDTTLETAAALIVALPVLLVYVFFQRNFIRGMLSGALKG
jgi:raffinose/stachyose/melibiose transport system permease protein